MLKVEFKKAEVDMDVDETAINNIVQSDRHYKQGFLMMSMIGWLNNDKNRNYQGMELMLRAKQCNSYLVAKPINKMKKNMKVTMPNDNKQIKKHELDVVFNVNDILKYHNSYEDNFIQLEHAGCYAYIDDPNEQKNENDENKTIDEKSNELKDVSFKEDNFEYNLSQNSVYLMLKQMNGDETIIYVSECMERKFDRKPDRTITGKITVENKDYDVYTFTIANQIISECAWITKENKIELIDLRSLKMEQDEQKRLAK
jgi:hypothetical protein